MSFAYPKVLRNPLTVPSAYKDTMSPKCRRLDDPISFILLIYWWFFNVPALQTVYIGCNR
jgi:hypothetical protein